MKLPIYMDYHATTPVDPRVVEAMLPFFTEKYGNAASRSHAFGWESETAVDEAREQVAGIIGAGAKEIIFTSGATESNNLAIKGAAAMYKKKGNHIVTQATEHKAVLDTCQRLASEGFEISYLPVNRYGRVTGEHVAEAIRPDTILVSVMYGNNETGTIQPIHDIGVVCKARGVFFHCDATQAVGKVPIDVEVNGIDLLSLSAHKLYGPKGVGALFVRRKDPRVRLMAQMDGGGHERGYRSGTLNVPGIVGLGAACEIARQELIEEGNRLSGLRNRLERTIIDNLGRVFTNGDVHHRLPGVANLSFADADGASILRSLDDVAVSSGSACTSASMAASHVLRAMGLDDELAYNSIRFSLGRFTTEADVDYVTEKVIRVVRSLRGVGAAECEVSCEV